MSNKQDKKLFESFMRAQKEEIEKYKWIQSEKAGHDLGNECCLEWISKFAKEYREKYFSCPV